MNHPNETCINKFTPLPVLVDGVISFRESNAYSYPLLIMVDIILNRPFGLMKLGR